jgi:hypothetical protein
VALVVTEITGSVFTYFFSQQSLLHVDFFCGVTFRTVNFMECPSIPVESRLYNSFRWSSPAASTRIRQIEMHQEIEAAGHDIACLDACFTVRRQLLDFFG